LAATEREAATGKRIRTVSDDPLGVALMRLDRRLRATEPFRRNSRNSSGPTGTVGFTNGVNLPRSGSITLKAGVMLLYSELQVASSR